MTTELKLIGITYENRRDYQIQKLDIQRIKDYPFPYETELKKVKKELSNPNYKRVNFVLGDDATPLEKSKYEICQNIARYKRENDLSEKEIGKKLGIKPAKRLECLFF